MPKDNHDSRIDAIYTDASIDSGRLIKYWRYYAIAALFFMSTASSDGQNAIDATRSILEQWVETERVISREKQNIELSKEILNERIALVEREIASLRERIKETEEHLDEANEIRMKLTDETTSQRTISMSLDEHLITLEDRIRTLLNRSPDLLRERIKPLSQRLTGDRIDSNRSLSERFQNVIGIMNEVDKFNRDLTLASELRILDDDVAIEVTALYVGLAQSYFTSANDLIAGVGTATDEGWKWSQRNDAAKAISQAIAILKNESVAVYVQLPVELQ